MTNPDEHTPLVELTGALDELLNEIAEVKQARWLTAGNPLHAAFDELMSFLGSSVQAIILHEEQSGASALAPVTPTGRLIEKVEAHTPDALARVVARHIELLAESVAAHASALSASDEPSAALLVGISRGLDDRQRSIRAAVTDTETS